MIIAEKIDNAMDPSQFNLFQTVEKEAIDGTKFMIKEPIGTTSIAGLTIEKANHQKQIELIDQKIQAINQTTLQE